MKYLCTLLLLVSGLLLLHPQAKGQTLLPEKWEGILTQSGSKDTFLFRLALKQDGDLVTGSSVSVAPDGRVGRFSLAGRWNGQVLLLQELEQQEPKGERWCLKYLTLELSTDKQAAWKFSGPWKAESCPPGEAFLSPVQGTELSGRDPIEVPFTLEGLWTGHLSQSDREYGFYFEMELFPDGKGISSIVSESSGGRAYHNLRWSFDAKDSTLKFEELDVARKTAPDWKWCIKEARLVLEQESFRYTLEGNWTGYLEGFSRKSGPCAPGTLYLEKPALPGGPESHLVDALAGDSLVLAGRKLKIERRVEVARPDLKIKLWDNGTEDGDVVTIFLNGKKIANRFRITKGKASVHVKLQQEFNLLVLFAENIGSISPNTVALSIDDGVREQILVLSADLTESGAVLIRQFTLKE